MRITHVIRAEEHLVEHAAPADALRRARRTPPRFAHVPLILNRRSHEDEQARGRGRGRGGRLAARGLSCPRRCSAIWRCSGSIPATIARCCRAPSCSRRSRSTASARAARCSIRTSCSWMNAHYLHHASGAQLARLGRGRSCPPRAQALAARARARCSRSCAAISRRSPTCRASWRRSSTTRPQFEPTAREALGSPARRDAVRGARGSARARLRNGVPRCLNPRFNRVGQRLGREGHASCSSRSAPRSPGARTAPSCRWWPSCSGRERVRGAPRGARRRANGRRAR